jgi:hypothetical protein
VCVCVYVCVSVCVCMCVCVWVWVWVLLLLFEEAYIAAAGMGFCLQGTCVSMCVHMHLISQVSMRNCDASVCTCVWSHQGVCVCLCFASESIRAHVCVFVLQVCAHACGLTRECVFVCVLPVRAYVHMCVYLSCKCAHMRVVSQVRVFEVSAYVHVCVFVLQVCARACGLTGACVHMHSHACNAAGRGADTQAGTDGVFGGGGH